MRAEVLQRLHASHPGQDRTLRRARQVVSRPNITNDVRNIVRSCAECAERLPSQAPEPLLPTPRPSRPFESVAADLFHFSGSTYLLMTDIYSGWPVVGRIGSTASSSSVINMLKNWMTDKEIDEHHL